MKLPSMISSHIGANLCFCGSSIFKYDGLSLASIAFLLLLLSAAAIHPVGAQSAPPSGSQDDAYYNNKFSPSMGVIIIILISALFFMGFFSIYIRHCSEDSSTSPGVRNPGSVARSRRNQRGLDPTVIESFPTFEYSAVRSLHIGKGALECAVCLNEFEDDETLRLIPKCDHVFHPECIDAWLVAHTTCPVCRRKAILYFFLPKPPFSQLCNFNLYDSGFILLRFEFRMQMEEMEDNSSSVMCQLADPEGTPLGAPLYLPQNAGPKELQQIVNQLLNNEEKIPYAFYISDRELAVQLGSYLEKNKVSVEKVVQIVYQPQAVFRIRPVNRCSASISGHTEAVLAVAFSPDGRHLASGSGDTSVRLWDLNTQTPMYTCTGHKNWVLCIAWSPDGKHLVSGSKAGELQCWDPETGKASGNPLKGHKKWITGISWEPVHLQAPCRRFVSASKDGDARIWDISLKKCVICLSGHTLAVTCVKWGGDGVIYTGSQDCTIKVWETKQGKLIRELKGHGHWINSLALSTEYVLRTGAFDHTRKQYSSPEEMQEVALTRYKKTLGNAPERLVSGSDDFTMFLWEPVASKHPKTRMTGHQQLVNHVYFSPDGQWIASASFDKSVKLWNGVTGKFVAAFRGHVGPVYQISWSADSRLILSGSKDSTLKIWDIRTHKLKQDLPGHADEVFAVDWSPDGEKVASGGKDRVLKLWMG